MAYLSISPLHATFRLPQSHSSLTVSIAVAKVKPSDFTTDLSDRLRTL
jgi:hypothetical protein